MSNEFVEYIKDILESFEIDKVKAMFGGFGIYKNNIMFAIIADQELYFKADEQTTLIFKASGSEPFTYKSRGRKVKMSYWKVPSEILENQELLEEWYKLAYDSAIFLKKK